MSDGESCSLHSRVERLEVLPRLVVLGCSGKQTMSCLFILGNLWLGRATSSRPKGPGADLRPALERCECPLDTGKVEGERSKVKGGSVLALVVGRNELEAEARDGGTKQK